MEIQNTSITNFLFSPSSKYPKSQGEGLHSQKLNSYSQQIESMNQVLSHSKRMIDQLSAKRLKMGSSSTISRPLNIKQRIQGSVRELQSNHSVAEQVLYIPNEGGKKTFNQNASNKYMDIVESMYKKGQKKCKSVKKRNRHHQTDSDDDEKPRKTKKQSIQLQLKQHLNSNAQIQGIRHYANQNDDDEDKQKNNKQNKKIKQKLEDHKNKQLQLFDETIKSKRSIPSRPSIETKIQKRHQLQTIVKRNQKKKLTAINEKADEQESIVTSEAQQQNIPNRKSKKNQQLFHLTLSQSQESEENQQSEQIKRLLEQINKDIQKTRQSTKKNIKASESQLNLKNQQNQNQISDIKVRKNNIYSFKHSSVNSQLSQSQSQSRDLFDIPKQLTKKSKIQQNQNQNQNQSSDSVKTQQIPYHTNYGIDISQKQIYKIMQTISHRIRLSPIVIDMIPYEHPRRQDNHQLQIETRVIKQQKKRKNIKEKILQFKKQKQSKNRFQNQVNKYRKAQTNVKKMWMKYPFKIDQAGNRVLRDDRIWRSPGKSLLEMDKFKSLNSPVLKGNCCETKSKKTYQNDNKMYGNHRSLLICKSAQTLSTLNSKFYAQKNKIYKINSEQYFDNENESNIDYSSISYENEQCIVRNNQWDSIKRRRRQIEHQNTFA